MAAVKNPATTNTGTSGTFAVGTNYPGTDINIATEDFADAYITFTTGATAPTGAAVATVMVSPDGTTFYACGTFPCSLAASTTETAVIPIPASAQAARVDVSGPTGTAVTGNAQIGYGTF